MKNLYKIFGILSALFSVQAVAQEGAHVKKSYTTYDLFYMDNNHGANACLLYTSPSPRDRTRSRMPSSA